MKLNTLFAAILLTGCVVCSVQADVVLDFNSDTEGFVGANGGAVAQDPTVNGGALKVTALGGGDFFEAASRAATLSFAATSPIGMELALAEANGGSIAFDIFVLDNGVTFAAGPGNLEIQLNLESGFSRDTEVEVVSAPSGATVSDAFFAAIIPGSGNEFIGTNEMIQYTDSGTRSISLGFKDGGDAISTGMFFIDNFTVSANAAVVPEPSSLLVLGSFAGLALIRRKRQIA